MNGTYYVVEAVPISKSKTVKVVSAYMIEEGKTPPGKMGKNNAGQPSRLPDADAPWFTAKTDSASSFPATDTTVPQAEQGVKNQYTQNAAPAFKVKEESPSAASDSTVLGAITGDSSDRSVARKDSVVKDTAFGMIPHEQFSYTGTPESGIPPVDEGYWNSIMEEQALPFSETDVDG